MAYKETSSDDLSLLTRKERDWLLGNIQVSGARRRDLRYRIRKKLEIFQNEEVPLLIQNGFFNANPNTLTPLDRCATTDAACVVTNHDTVASNHDGTSHTLEWSSLVKIPPQTWREIDESRALLSKIETKSSLKRPKWAGSGVNCYQHKFWAQT